MVPQGLATVDGGTQYILGPAYTFQELVGTTHLTQLPIGAIITGLQFRLEGNNPNPAASFANFDVYLGPSTSSTLGPDTAGNQGPGTVLVRAGSLTFDAGSFPSGSGPNSFGPVIVFSAPFTYLGGQLLLTVSYTDSSAPFNLDAGLNNPDIDFRQSAGYNTGTLSQSITGAAVPLQFVYIVPEPGSVTLLLCGGAVLILLRRQGRLWNGDPPHGNTPGQHE